ncbi:MAG TPA: hypothetical protein VLT33_47730 [Labilithrix sp.]|nr:hypothetical protein [Labilithrix sp.]
MTTTVFMGGRRVRLEDRDLLGQGGEGRVFRVGDRAVKVFFTMTEERKKKLAAFPTAMPGRVIGPLDLCTDAQGVMVGYAMRALEGAVDAHRLGQRKWREAAMRAPDVLRVFRELAATVAQLHALGVVVGDLNDGNVVLTPPQGAAPWQPWFIDADSMQWRGFPCTVAHERFLDPRLYGIDLAHTGALSRESDWYALAVLLFSSLLFVHPYGGAHASFPTLLRRAEGRHSVLRGDVKLPHAALRPDVLSDDALAWFTSVFDRDARTPLPEALLASRFVRCACGVEHARRVCPICTVAVAMPTAVRTFGRLRATTIVRAPRGGRIVAAAVPRSLTYVIELDGELTREDGRSVDSADLGCDALVRIDGDWLSRTADGTRIGQILEGQTHVRTGAALGFAFYRAGLVTVSLLFDTRRGPLRQLALPHLEGKLVDWSVAFDDGHALFCAATEKAGRVIHSAHLVDARGELLASEVGPAGSSAILAGISGKCLASGAVLVPTDDGLVLVRADRATRSFVPLRAFPETRDLVPPDADLLVGPGGSVYVVTHDEIVHLCFEGNPSS